MELSATVGGVNLPYIYSKTRTEIMESKFELLLMFFSFT